MSYITTPIVASEIVTTLVHKRDGLTNSELVNEVRPHLAARNVYATPQSIRSRATEMARVGTIRRTARKRPCTVTGRTVAVWVRA